MGKKQDVLSELYALCKQRNNFVFTNENVKAAAEKFKFKNPFDATKIDHMHLLPEILRLDDMFVVHLGGGMHKFVRGVKNGYHRMETIPEEQIRQWDYHPSLLNNINSSESNSLSMANNQRIIHHFLYGDISISPRVYNSNRTKIPMQYTVGDAQVNIEKLQMEIDLTVEHEGEVTFFEAKNGNPRDFNVFQLFHPYRYYLKVKSDDGLAVKTIRGCYLVRHRRVRGGGGGGGICRPPQVVPL